MLTNVTNVTFDTSVQNDIFNFTDDVNNRNIRYNNKNLENIIKNKIKENKEIKQIILILMNEIKSIKQKQEMIIKNENENMIQNNLRNIKVSNLIKRTYNFLNDFNKVINEKEQLIYQEIIENLKSFFKD